MRSESAAHSVTYTRVPRLSLLLRSEGAAFKASVLKSVVKRFQVGFRGWPSASKIEAKILSKFELNLDHPGGK